MAWLIPLAFFWKILTLQVEKIQLLGLVNIVVVWYHDFEDIHCLILAVWMHQIILFIEWLWQIKLEKVTVQQITDICEVFAHAAY